MHLFQEKMSFSRKAPKIYAMHKGSEGSPGKWSFPSVPQGPSGNKGLGLCEWGGACGPVWRFCET